MAATSIVLAIETSQRVGTVALREAGGTVHVELLATAQRHDDDLVPALDRLRARVDLDPRSIDVVAVSVGPGGFTGLRIAVSTAKMMAEAIGCKIIAVPSALVAAENFNLHQLLAHTPSGRPHAPSPAILVALAAKRDTVWATSLVRHTGHWRIAGDPGLAAADSIELPGLTAVVGDEHLPSTLRDQCEAAGIAVIPPTFDAAACLRVAERLAAEGRFADPIMLLPIYPRPPDAVSIWEARENKSDHIL